MIDPDKNRILLIGPLPPPNGGARVSFKLFMDHLKQTGRATIHHFDLPVRRNRGRNPPGGTDHIRTMGQTFKILAQLPFMNRVILFGSNNFALSYGLVVIVYGKIWKKRPVIRFFGGHPLHSLQKIPGPAAKVVLALIGCADKIIVQTRYGADRFPSHLKPKIRIVPGYRDMPVPRASGKKNQSGGGLKILYTGRIHPDKGIDILLESFSRLYRLTDGKVEWHVYGAGAPDITRRLASRPGITYHGNVGHETLLTEIPLYDLFVFPTHYDLEGHPGSLIEALMAGIPAVVSDHPCVREIIQHQYNGLILKKNDSSELCRALLELYNNRKLLEDLSRGAQHSGQWFDAGKQLKRLTEECLTDQP